MKPAITLLSAIFIAQCLSAQPVIKEKKYPSLLWEIRGKGISKPSFLIGTMHVSSKLAFHLPDSFYYAVRNAQVVALETNPETWQDDMEHYQFGPADADHGLANNQTLPDSYLRQSTLKFYPYASKIENALTSNPSTINSLLYRTYGNESSDYEEDTYLDMYIFQCGRKLGKRVTGVENYGESMKLMEEAYRDGAKDKNKKSHSYEDADDYSNEKLQEAYRNGNLDLLDTINKFNSESAAFDEKFIYRRNEIQANSIDSIIRSGNSLFVGVGAAHLPGNRGVIELLRKKGYTLRPVKMGERDSRDKEQLDAIRVPVTFHTETARDGFFKVDVPGKLYNSADDGDYYQVQFSDMANGSYYMVTRVMTNAWLFSDNEAAVQKKTDSLLYENIPGKMISRKSITKNGYRGFDIINRTRRGDLQHYQIFITPFEVVIFKMSGNADYVSKGEEGNRFFNSIQMKEYKPADAGSAWKSYSPPAGGFRADFPHDPYIGNDGSWLYDAMDKSTGTEYRLVQSSIHNYHFAEEDSFDLGLMEESFRASDFVNQPQSRHFHNWQGYPALDVRYSDQSGGFFDARFLIQGPHYYTLIAHKRKGEPASEKFFKSFSVKPFVYNATQTYTDTTLKYTVQTDWLPVDDKVHLQIRQNSYGYDEEEDDDEEDSDESTGGNSYLGEKMTRGQTISNDSTGEKIYVSRVIYPEYFHATDTASWRRSRIFPGNDTSWIVRSLQKSNANGFEVTDFILSDSGSSRTVHVKEFYKNGVSFHVATGSDTLSEPSPFVRRFFDTFKPADTLQGADPFLSKTGLFFNTFNSPDSAIRKKARGVTGYMDMDSADLPGLKKLISGLGWQEKKYLDTKGALIEKLGGIPTVASADYLKQLYFACDDTVQLQYPVLNALVEHQNSYSWSVLRDILKNEPPVLDIESGDGLSFNYTRFLRSRGIRMNGSNYRGSNFISGLSDSLALAKTILPDILPLVNLEDYKDPVMGLLAELADSNLLKPGDYSLYLSKFLLEARQALKKQKLTEKKAAIEKAEKSKDKKKSGEDEDGDDSDTGDGNDELELYARILMPLRDMNPQVKTLLDQMMQSDDKKLKYAVFMQHCRQGKNCPDTMYAYFAAQDEYRYDLYSDLKEMNKLKLFPSRYNNHLDLCRSKLLTDLFNSKPDSLVFAERLYTSVRGQGGYLYFFKYKKDKEELGWKAAVVGLVPEDPAQFEFDSQKRTTSGTGYSGWMIFQGKEERDLDFSDVTDDKLKEDKNLEDQLNAIRRKLVYAKRKSAKNFYGENNYGNNRLFID